MRLATSKPRPFVPSGGKVRTQTLKTLQAKSETMLLKPNAHKNSDVKDVLKRMVTKARTNQSK